MLPAHRLSCSSAACSAAPCCAVRCRAAPFGAVPCRAMPCGAVLCRAVRRLDVLRALLHLLFCNARNHSKYHTRYRYYYARFIRITLLIIQNALPALSSAAPCGAVPCGAVPFPAVRWYAMPRRDVFFSHTLVLGIMRSTMYQVPVCACILFFLLSSFDLLSEVV